MPSAAVCAVPHAVDLAIRLAKLLGAQVGTTTSTGNVDLVRSLGADEVVDYKQQAFARARRANFVLKVVFALMSRRVKGLAKKRDVDYSFLFARADGDQLAQIGKLREELTAQKTQVLALHMAYVDTDLTRGFDVPKSSPQAVVQRALDALEAGYDEVLADELTLQVKAGLTAARPSYLPQRA